MPQSAPVWVGELDRRNEFADLRVDPEFTAARLLVTAGGAPVGLVELELGAGHATAAEVRAAVSSQLGHVVDPPLPPTSHEPLTIVIPTRGRAASLQRCVRAVLAGDHPRVSVLVVDNDPVDDATFRAVAGLADNRVRYVHESRRGASVARNRGLHEATTDVVAFLDDDTEPDRHWAARVSGVFAADPTLACLSGPVLAARLTTADEIAADKAAAWCKGFVGRRFCLADPPTDSAIFPFSPGLFGIGANLAVRTDVARAAGGFDEALGPGTPSHGGEDCEFLVRLVLAGHVLCYAPAAYVWHHHRPTATALRSQIRGYSIGLGSFLAKIAFDSAARAMAVRRIPAALAQLWRIRTRAATSGGTSGSTLLPLMHGLALGSIIYMNPRRAARRSGARIPPLTLTAGRYPSGLHEDLAEEDNTATSVSVTRRDTEPGGEKCRSHPRPPATVCRSATAPSPNTGPVAPNPQVRTP